MYVEHEGFLDVCIKKCKRFQYRVIVWFVEGTLLSLTADASQ